MGRRRLRFSSKSMSLIEFIRTSNGEGLDCGPEKHQAAKNLEVRIKLNKKLKNKS